MDFLNDGIWLIFLFSGIINMLWLLCAVCLRNTQWRYIFLHAGACHGKNFKSFWLENIMNIIIGRANIFVFDIAFFIFILCLWTPKNMNTKPKNIINHFRSFFCSHIFFRFRIVLSILCAPSFFHRLPRKRFLFYFIFCGLCEYKCMHVRTGRFPYTFIHFFLNFRCAHATKKLMARIILFGMFLFNFHPERAAVCLQNIKMYWAWWRRRAIIVCLLSLALLLLFFRTFFSFRKSFFYVNHLVLLLSIYYCFFLHHHYI